MNFPLPDKKIKNNKINLSKPSPQKLIPPSPQKLISGKPGNEVVGDKVDVRRIRILPNVLAQQIAKLSTYGFSIKEIGEMVDETEEQIKIWIQEDPYEIFRKSWEQNERGELLKKVEKIEEERDLKDTWWEIERWSAKKVLEEVSNSLCDSEYALKVAKEARSVNGSINHGRADRSDRPENGRDGGYVNNLVRIEIGDSYKGVGQGVGQSTSVQVVGSNGSGKVLDGKVLDGDGDRNGVLREVDGHKTYDSLDVKGVKKLLMSEQEQEHFEELGEKTLEAETKNAFETLWMNEELPEKEQGDA